MARGKAWLRSQTNTLIKRVLFYDMWKNNGEVIKNVKQKSFEVHGPHGCWRISFERIEADG